MGIFLLIVPSLIIGPRFNAECLGMWWHRMVMPFVAEGAASPAFINQSIVGVLYRLLTSRGHGPGPYDLDRDVNLVSLPPGMRPAADQGRRGRPAGAAGLPLPDQDAPTAATRGCWASSRWSS